MKTKYFSVIGALVVVSMIVFGGGYYYFQTDHDIFSHQAGESISWNDAITIINNEEVKSIFQSHDLDVSIALKNGKVFDTKEPSIDDIFKEIEKCGENCKNIIVATE
jgi:hypothetical protein